MGLDRKVMARFDPSRGALRMALLAGASLLALMIGSSQGKARNLSTPSGAVAPPAAAVQQITAGSIQAQVSLARAAAALAAMPT